MFLLLLNKQVSLLLNAPHPHKITLKNGASKSNFPHFKYLENSKSVNIMCKTHKSNKTTKTKTKTKTKTLKVPRVWTKQSLNKQMMF